jgi:hypothetical protein
MATVVDQGLGNQDLTVVTVTLQRQMGLPDAGHSS